ncbi:hypothetical protein MKX01_038637 [Papaver californicum]|nr:hypothetical protein MKX01_038637 [Papaver californicum]
MKKKAAAFLFLCLIFSCLFIAISGGISGGGGGRSGGSSSGGSSGSSSRGSDGRSSGGSGMGGGRDHSYTPGVGYGYNNPTTGGHCRTNSSRCNTAGSIMINQHKSSAFPLFVTLTAISLVI